jgi:hypothetical protein
MGVSTKRMRECTPMAYFLLPTCCQHDPDPDRDPDPDPDPNLDPSPDRSSQ